MNTYELEIYLDQKERPVQFDQPIHQYVECEEHILKSHLDEISSKGFFIEYDQYKIYIPGRRIEYILTKFLEKQQIIPNVSESIKAALKEE
jgi:hypothetical protein